VLQVDAKGLTQIAFADSSALRVGDYVVAIGNPFGLDQTVTSGIVSALGRSGLGIEGYEDFIQTDASINPGNSGGALVNLRGELVGINTAILAPAGGNVGIGFAIPSNLVRAIMQQLIQYGEVKRGRLGVRIQPLSADLAEAFAVNERKGVVVVGVDRNSAAARAGIQPGDVVVSINGHPIRRVADFYSQSALLMVGDKVAVDVLRDGAVESLQADIETDQYEQMVGDEVDSRLSGVELRNFRSQGDATTDSGVLVTDVTDNSLAWARGLRAGDIIVALNRHPCRNLKDFVAAARQVGNQLLLRVYRAGEFGYIVLD
jgi:S1-C subfamily serine protease